MPSEEEVRRAQGTLNNVLNDALLRDGKMLVFESTPRSPDSQAAREHMDGLMAKATPVPPDARSVTLGVGVDEQLRSVVLTVEVMGHPRGPFKIQIPHTREAAAKLAHALAMAAESLTVVTRQDVILPKHARGEAPILKLPERKP